MSLFDEEEPPEYDCASFRAINALRTALIPTSKNNDVWVEDPSPILAPQFWPSTLSELDDGVGGFYGLSAITGEPGCGKSLLGCASGIEAASSGKWQVVHFFAENDVDDIRERFNRYVHHHTFTQAILANYHPVSTGFGQDKHSLCEEAVLQVDFQSDLPILIIIDSINSIMNANPKVGYLSGMSDLLMWMAMARRDSRGECSFLMTAEANQRGNAKGESVGFLADVDLRVAPTKGSKDVVAFNLQKTRRTASIDMGLYLRQNELGDFRCQSDFNQPAREEYDFDKDVIDLASRRANCGE